MSEFLSMPILTGAPTFALGVAINGAGIGALLLLVVWLLRRRSERWRYGILLGGTVVLLAVPALVGVGLRLPPEFFRPPTPEEVLKLPAERLSELLARPDDAAANKEAAVAEANGPSVQILSLALVGLWMFGIVLGMVRFTSAFFKQSRILVGQPWQAAYWTDALQSRFARQLGLAKFPPVYRSPVAPMPMVVGTWRPVIVVPEQTPATWGQPQWEAILLHEAAHIARRDPWAVLAQRLAVILFWWCPFVHGISRRLSAWRENICDDYALAGACDPLAYAEILIESAERLLSLKSVPVRLALLDSAQRGLEVRVTRLLAKEKRPMTKSSLLGKLLGAGVLGAACLATTAATALSQPQPEKKVQIKIVVDGKEIDLSDPRLLEHIQAAQKKSEPHRGGVQFQIVPDAAANYRMAIADNYRMALAEWIAKKADDPRVEELVKQAEAIKPGSGAAIRKALQGAADKSEAVKKKAVMALMTLTPDGKQMSTSGADGSILIFDSTTGKSIPAHVQFTTGKPASIDSADGKKIIILSIEGDKVIQLQKADVKKYLEVEGGLLSISPSRKETDLKMRLEFDRGVQSIPSTAERVPTRIPASADTKKTERVNVKLVQSKSSDTKPAAPNPAADLEALRRQIERLSAEMKALERRLEVNSKK